MGNNFAIFIFASLLNGDQLLKERICSSRSTFFPLREDPIWEGLVLSGLKRKSQKGRRILAVYPIT